MSTKPYFFKSRTAAIVIGGAALGFGWFCFRDAYNRRGQRPPFPLRIIGVTGPQ